ncbi:hypothetical protein C7S18_15695 [Ahniella affigens]|uniref:Uncharacterized protein n=1 Tax=Ahniella affigens TaxID=2021234 RepID=A0A2P1PUP5_9GAMM|nr:hypothetical protein C7S18_15695 [Ahniella affigens]
MEDAIADADAIDGQMIQVCGNLELHFEGNTLCEPDPKFPLRLEDYCIEVAIGGDWTHQYQQYRALEHRTACAFGTFEKTVFAPSDKQVVEGLQPIQIGANFHVLRARTLKRL